MAKRYSAVLLAVMAMFFLNTPVESKPVKGYNSYIELLPGGKQTQMINLDIVIRAQSQVARTEKEKREREIKFNRPLDVFDLNSKYFMIAFDVSYKPTGNSRYSANPAVYALMFEKNGSISLKKYSESYIKWIGSVDVENYRNSDISDFCEFFKEIGVEDCEADKIVPAEEKIEPKGEINPQVTVKTTPAAREIPKDLVSKKELNQIIEEKDKKISELVSAIDAQNKTMKALTDRLKTLESTKSESIPINTTVVQKVSERQLNYLKSRIHELEKQTYQYKELENAVFSLTSLLNGVSRNKNDIILTGLNLKIVNGTGNTEGDDNGTGNLIVGYNEKKPGENLKAGSHKIIAPDLETISEAIGSVPDSGQKNHNVNNKNSGLCFIETALF